ncbi:MAG: hypothetical protein C4B57_10545 [Deltaproteobacteria bacterium]|nr:MAG: hypothetical protein C4B57_10545 [Deltaproteobacteria bacterium]
MSAEYSGSGKNARVIQEMVALLSGLLQEIRFPRCTEGKFCAGVLTIHDGKGRKARWIFDVFCIRLLQSEVI